MDDLFAYVQQKLAEQKVEFDNKLEEQKSGFAAELDNKLAEQKVEFAAELAEQKSAFEATLAEVKGIIDNLVDPRLKCWNQGSATSRGNASISTREIRRAVVNRMGVCMCCGTDGSVYKQLGKCHGLTTAHIIADMKDLNVLFGQDNGYKENIILECESNYLVLCGTQGQRGSCHDAYDNLELSLYFNKEVDRYVWMMNDGGDTWLKADGSIERLGTLDSSVIGYKYARLLNWRTIRTLLQPGTQCVLSTAERTQLINNLKIWEEDECDD